MSPPWYGRDFEPEWTDRDFEARDERLEAREGTGWYEEWVGPGVEGPTGEVTAGSSPAASPDPALVALVSMFEKDVA